MSPSEKTEQVLQQRYPNLSFLTSLLSQKKKSDDIIPDLNLPSFSSLSQIDVLYVYGLSCLMTENKLFKWLQADKKRDLVFLEEDIDRLSAFFSSEFAYDVLNHPQVHIRFNMDCGKLDCFLEQCASDFPMANIEIVSLSKQGEKDRFKKIEELLKRKTVVSRAYFLSSHYHYKIFENRLKNTLGLPKAFFGNHLKETFKNIPAIVCGAGPSLYKEIDRLKYLGDRALIIAGGSALTALTHHGVLPHMGVASDPNFEEYVRFKDSFAFEIPIFYINQLHHKVFETFNGPCGYLKTLAGSSYEEWMEKKLNIGLKPLDQGFDTEALSVTTLCIEIASLMECNPIILTGVDLAFSKNSTYCPGIFQDKTPFEKNPNQVLKRQDIFGQEVKTTLEWEMESATISRFAKKHRKKMRVINATQGGIGFEGIPNQALETIFFKQAYDIQGMLHHAIKQRTFSLGKKDVNKHLNTLYCSLKTAGSLCKSALSDLNKTKGKKRDPETGHLILCQMEVEALDAYRYLLFESERFLPLLERQYNRHRPWRASEEEKNRIKWDSFNLKWSHFQFLIDFHLNIMSRYLFTE